MEPFKKREQFLSCNVLNQLGNHPADATIVDHINADAPADHPDASFDDQENASNVIEAEENALDLSIRHNGDETKVTGHEAGGAYVNDGKQVNESKELVIEGDANGVAFMAVIGDGIQPDETKVIEHAGGGEHTDDPIEGTGIAGDGGAPDNVGDGEHTDKPKEVIGNAVGDAAGGAIGDGEHTGKPKAVIERAGGGGGAPDAIGDGEHTHRPIEVIENTGGDAADAIGDGEQTHKPLEVIENTGGDAADAIGDGEHTDKPKEVIENNEQEHVVEMEDVTFIIDGGSSGNALDTMDDGKQMHVVDDACIVGGGDLTIRTCQDAQTEGKQEATFLVPVGNHAAVTPGGGTSPMDDGIQNEQTHTYCTKRKSKEPGKFSYDAGESGHDAPIPKRTKHGDAGGDEIGTRSSSITPPVAGNRTLRLFGVNISCDVQENPVMHQPRRTFRLFGVDISSPKDQE